MRIIGGSPSFRSAVKGLVNVNSRREPVCFKCSEGLVNVNCRREPVSLKSSEGLVNVN